MANDRCYNEIAPLLGDDIEPFGVVRTVEAHRWFWRPRGVNVVLLAESHVLTTVDECVLMAGIGDPRLNRIPRRFARIVYCAGYGEPNYTGREIPNNIGTAQFWKIFASCAGHTNFKPYLKSGNPRFEDRIGAKIDLLTRLRRMGVWLLDASVAALYLCRRV